MLPRLFCFALCLFTTTARADDSYTLGMVAKSQGNQFFEAARAGANDAARELGAKHGITIRIDWRTPNEEDAQKQADFIEQLVLSGADGIIVSCSDANKLTDAINKAVDAGLPVVTFSGDAPASRRMVSIGIDDFASSERTVEELARRRGGQGVVAARSEE
ncbi:MAG: ribose transport system substrate-binding protein, partial [Verrucomicrobiota bacterium]|nr:ribose transport system substrate-binding protein [Verrucomicrobiota bacterium]